MEILEEKDAVSLRLNELGIPETRLDFHWIAEQSLLAPLPEHWEKTPHGYLNSITKVVQDQPPTLTYFKQLYRILSNGEASVKAEVCHCAFCTHAFDICLVK